MAYNNTKQQAATCNSCGYLHELPDKACNFYDLVEKGEFSFIKDKHWTRQTSLDATQQILRIV